MDLRSCGVSSMPFQLLPGPRGQEQGVLNSPIHSLAHLFTHSFIHSLTHVLSSRLVLRVQIEENTVCLPGAYSGESGSLVFMGGGGYKHSGCIQTAAEGFSTRSLLNWKLTRDARQDREGHLRLEPQVQGGQACLQCELRDQEFQGRGGRGKSQRPGWTEASTQAGLYSVGKGDPLKGCEQGGSEVQVEV